MPDRVKRAIAKRTTSFRTRYAELEAKRRQICERLDLLNPNIRNHRTFKSIQNLLGPKFRSAALAKRMAVLESAEWLLNVLETMAPIA
jgi:hypothetical protein